VGLNPHSPVCLNIVLKYWIPLPYNLTYNVLITWSNVNCCCVLACEMCLRITVIIEIDGSERWTVSTNQNYVKLESTGTLNSRSDCYHWIKDLLSSHVLSKDLRIIICKTIILPVLYDSETWPPTLERNVYWGYLKTKCWGRC
jgi:hypothetical protein